MIHVTKTGITVTEERTTSIWRLDYTLPCCKWASVAVSAIRDFEIKDKIKFKDPRVFWGGETAKSVTAADLFNEAFTLAVQHAKEMEKRIKLGDFKLILLDKGA